MKKHWYDERYSDDAPVWYDAPEANAWAAGYNAAVQACIKEQNEIFLRELGKS